jgi:hypothetical protein
LNHIYIHMCVYVYIYIICAYYVWNASVIYLKSEPLEWPFLVLSSARNQQGAAALLTSRLSSWPPRPRPRPSKPPAAVSVVLRAVDCMLSLRAVDLSSDADAGPGEAEAREGIGLLLLRTMDRLAGVII